LQRLVLSLVCGGPPFPWFLINQTVKQCPTQKLAGVEVCGLTRSWCAPSVSMLASAVTRKLRALLKNTNFSRLAYPLNLDIMLPRSKALNPARQNFLASYPVFTTDKRLLTCGYALYWYV
jgi:hypothetical protein